jgi:ectoine hydroxylase-related dioxygenase (phytanoyl-CoA dioxygenase family)
MFTPQQIEQYRREGYVVYPNLLSRGQVDGFHSEIESISAENTLAQHDKTRMEMEPSQPPDGTAVRRIYEPCTHYPTFRNLSESDKLLDCVEQLLGPDLVYHYSKINMKPPGVGSPVEWHQDLCYYPLSNRDSVSILFYLDHATKENGCLQVIPRMHELPPLIHNDGGFFRGKVTEAVDDAEAVPLEGEAGTVIFMNAMTPHASIANTSPHPRRTLILSYRAADALPIYCGEITQQVEQCSRLIRGKAPATIRFTMDAFPILRHESKFTSLYDLQERDRDVRSVAT